MKYILNNWITIIFLLSLIAILSALTAEFYFNLQPCKMCLNQRYGYYAIICLIIIFYLIKQITNILLSILNQISIVYGLFYAIWHVGIEQKFINGPKSCSGIINKTESLKDLKKQITNQEIINCMEITWSFFGISFATINSLLLLIIMIFNTMFIIKKYNESKKI